MKVVKSLVCCLVVLCGLTAVENLSSVKFFKLWQKYDKDGNDNIEAEELDKLCYDKLKEDFPDEEVSEKKESQFKETVLSKLDVNSDGKLDLSEAAVLLKVEDNFLAKMANHHDKVPPSEDEIIQMFLHYDEDNSSQLDHDEILGFMRDLQGLQKQVTSFHRVIKYTTQLLEIADTNQNSKLDIKEFAQILL